MARRSVVEIDEEKCDGCGRCVPSCAEGAIQIVHGKARLVSEVYCDGLGACLGHCPRGAITIQNREAEPFDEGAAHRHVEQMRKSSTSPRQECEAASNGPGAPWEHQAGPRAARGCPGSAVQSLLNVLPPAARQGDPPTEVAAGVSSLANWPIQLHLVPPGAAFLKGADLLLAADCVPAAYADFHGRLLKGKALLIGCPKLDDVHAYVEKLTAILAESSIRSLTVVHMEVPCCTGLVRIARTALAQAKSPIRLAEVTISIRGAVLEPEGMGTP